MRIVRPLALVASLALGWGAANLAAADTADAGAQTARVTLRIGGMSCASCGVAVRTALRQLDGVRSVAVDVDRKKADVTYEPRRVTPAQMVRAIERLGYRARVVTPS